MTPPVKPPVPEYLKAWPLPMMPLAALPAGVRLSDDGETLRKRCPACGGEIRVANEPGAVKYIAARNRICRPCDEDLRASL